MQEPRGRHFCLLAHNVVNKLSAILGYCELLDAESHGDADCVQRLHKIRGLASSAAALLQGGNCEVEAVTRILELENAFAALGNREESAGSVGKESEKQVGGQSPEKSIPASSEA